MITVSVPACAKLNLALRVLHKRPDGFHELRTVFQTISTADRLVIHYRPARKTSIQVGGSVTIPDNIVERAALLLLQEIGRTAHIEFDLEKRIPMGGGLGGGSSDAAAVLLALPVLARRRVPMDRLLELAARLGSDVPFFLLGGAALGFGRGEELFPIPEPPPAWGLLAAPPISVSTAEAYRDLRRDLTVMPNSFKINEFQSSGWVVADRLPLSEWSRFCQNDFEATVFERYPRLGKIKRILERAGAAPALMTGSGSCLFGIFASRRDAIAAKSAVARREPDVRIEVFHTLSRARYRARFLSSLKELALGESWPPQSLCAK